MERQSTREEFYYTVPQEVAFEDSPNPEVADGLSALQLGKNALTLVQGEKTQILEHHPVATENLYERILDSTLFTPPEAIDDTRPIAVDITSNHSLRLGSEKIKLGGRQLFFFNSIMLLRNAPRSAEELIELGFMGSRGIKDLNSSAKLFIERLNCAAGTELIRYEVDESGKRKYRVSDSLHINDRRDTPFSSPYAKLPKKKMKKTDSSLIPRLKKFDSYERAEFGSLMERGEVFKEIVRTYGDHPRINELLAITRLNSASAVGTEPEDTQQSSRRRQHRMLKKDEVSELFNRIEYGLVVHNKLGSRNPSLKDTSALVELSAAYNILYTSNLGLVTALASKIISQRSDPYFEDLFQEGSIGLGEAIRRYDYQKGIAFSTYATWWIKNSLNRGYDATARPVRLPAHQTLRWLQYKDAFTKTKSELGREPSDKEMVDITGFSPEEISDLTSFGPRHLPSLDAPLLDAPEKTRGDTVAVYDKEGFHAEPEIYRPALHPEMEEVILKANVTPFLQLMLSLRYGIFMGSLQGESLKYDGCEFKYEELLNELHSEGGELSNAEVAGIMGIKEESVIDGLSRAIKKIQKVTARRRRKFKTLPVRI